MANSCQLLETMARDKEEYSNGPCASFWRNYSIRDGHTQPGNPKASNELPSKHMDMSPEKARTILHDKEIRGHPLTEKQRGLFGAIAGKKK